MNLRQIRQILKDIHRGMILLYYEKGDKAMRKAV